MTYRTLAPLASFALIVASTAALACACESGGSKPAPATPGSASSTASASASASAAPSASVTTVTTASTAAPPSTSPADLAKGDMATLGRATVALGDDLLARVDEKGNVVFAPASVSAALSMTWAGARGDTATQMAKTLHLDGLSGGDAASGRAHAAWGALLASWSVKGEKEPVVEVANRLFGQQGYPFTPAFLALTKDRYGAALEPVDYVGATEAARGTINKWVSERTAKAIPELIGKGVLDKDTRLTLVNAIHLKGAWIEPFNAAATSPAKFHAPGGDVDVPTMNGVRHARWAETKDAQIVSLPFASAGAYDLELDVVLPSEKAGKPSLTAWSAAIDAAEQTHVSLSLPRFKVSSNLPLSKTLAAMGMPDAFSKEKADFSGIDGKKDLYVWAVVHQAVLDVYESGAEASAATAVVMATKGMVFPAHTMKVDRPFYVMLRDRKSGALLFVAHVRNPKG